ncbi:MAG: tetratricopeptide repeat protein [Oceanicaulis sp.]|uniref:tetratricopeptide repeat protein n=1 Tax=Glycocaulis sp. TaxID=1969725 RepID=UPI0025BDBEA4|nr:tetratricopeptide repeat protein [Glycocaulis sp.]MCC5982280.1 tetratricopeptide repeat protein [Oceanicaulis sp.]MCH8520737.1 tetratricopeptide repeat protein [Glycocaulis sp.]
MTERIAPRAIRLLASACLTLCVLPAINANAAGLHASGVQQAGIPPQDLAAIERHNAAAETAFRQSDFRTATREFEAAFLIYHRHLGLQHPLSAVAGANMGMAMLGQGRFAEALQVLEIADEILADVDPQNARRPGIQRAMEMARSRQDPGAPAGAQPAPQPQQRPAPGPAPQPIAYDSPDALNNEAARAYQAGDYARAETGFLQVLAAHERAGSGNSEAAGVAWVNLGEVYSQTQRLGEAENALARARAIFTALAPDHRYLAVVSNNLASVQNRQGGPAAALAGYEAALASMRATFGADHPNTAAAMGNVAGAYLALGRVHEARPFLEQARAIETAHHGAGSAEGFDTLSGLGQAYLDLGLYGEAIRLQEEAIAAFTRAEDANPRHLAVLRTRLGRAQQQAGLSALAERTLTRALAEAETAFGPGRLETVAALSALASAIFDQGRFGDAAHLQRRALTEAESLTGPNAASTLGAMQSNLAGTLRMLGELDESERLYRAALADARTRPGTVELATSLENLAGLRRLRGDLDEAARLQVEALTLYRDTLGETHPQTQRARANAGTTLGLAGDHAGAEGLMRGGLEGMEGRVPETHRALLIAHSNLGWLYLRHMNRSADALRLYRTVSASLIATARVEGEASETAEAGLLRRRNDLFQLHVDAAWSVANPNG